MALHRWQAAGVPPLRVDRILSNLGYATRTEARALVTLAPTKVLVDVRDAGGRGVSQHALPLEQLRPLMGEYMETITEMSKLRLSTNSPRLEALDIAKRITHDEAGETVVTLLGSLKPDHGTARRFFTLLVTLLYDTTKLGTAHPKPRR